MSLDSAPSTLGAERRKPVYTRSHLGILTQFVGSGFRHLFRQALPEVDDLSGSDGAALIPNCDEIDPRRSEGSESVAAIPADRVVASGLVADIQRRYDSPVNIMDQDSYVGVVFQPIGEIG